MSFLDLQQIVTTVGPGVALVAAVASILWIAAQWISKITEGRRRTARQVPGVQATINRMPSVDGWRSIQLHLLPPEEPAPDFDLRRLGWRIWSAQQLGNVQLADARANDGSLRGPILAEAEGTISSLRRDGEQDWAFEFFLRFPDTPLRDHGKQVRFRVAIGQARRTETRREVVVLATVPLDADTERSDPD